MTPNLLELLRESLLVAATVLAPVLIAGLIAGIVIGVVQTAMGLQDPLIGLVPRLAVMGFVLLLSLPWMLERLVELLRSTAVP